MKSSSSSPSSTNSMGLLMSSSPLSSSAKRLGGGLLLVSVVFLLILVSVTPSWAYRLHTDTSSKALSLSSSSSSSSSSPSLKDKLLSKKLSELPSPLVKKAQGGGGDHNDEDWNPPKIRVPMWGFLPSSSSSSDGDSTSSKSLSNNNNQKKMKKNKKSSQQDSKKIRAAMMIEEDDFPEEDVDDVEEEDDDHQQDFHVTNQIPNNNNHDWVVNLKRSTSNTNGQPWNTKRTKIYDVPQIECPPADDGMDRFACPSPDKLGRYPCVDDHVLCDGFVDCPGREDEDRQACMFYKTTKAHLDVLADALLRWARGKR